MFGEPLPQDPTTPVLIFAGEAGPKQKKTTQTRWDSQRKANATNNRTYLKTFSGDETW